MSFQISQNKKALKNAMELQAYVLQATAKALESIIPASQNISAFPFSQFHFSSSRSLQITNFSQLVDVAGPGCIVRVMTDRRTV